LSTQEVGLGIFVLLTVYYGLRFIREEKMTYFTFSLTAFIFSLLSKETAVVTPFLLAAVIIFDKCTNKDRLNLKKLIYSLAPYLLILAIYFYFRIFHYGFTTGDSYVWIFSIRRLANTLAWYFGWALGLPEMLVDYVGPGFHVNPTLWLYWSKEVVPILVLFVIEILASIYVFVKSVAIKRKSLVAVFIFSVTWFLTSLLPVAFLPFHKFTFYLTLPLMGVIFLLAYSLSTVRNSFLTVLLLSVWIVLSVLTTKFTVTTSWITQGEALSQRVYDYFSQNNTTLRGKKIVFVDTAKDVTLPWSPTLVVRQALSENNFFEVFFPDLATRVSYTGKGDIVIESRQFLGY